MAGLIVHTEPRWAVGEEGFTLIEVLIAMVLLAVGLLALQTLGIGAARATALAERNTRAAAIASAYLEEGLQSLRRNELPTQLNCSLNGIQVVRMVDTGNANLPIIEVTVTIPASVPRPFTIRSSSFSPTALPGPAPIGTCPP